MTYTCIVCGKKYKNNWIDFHFHKLHPKSKIILRTLEIVKALNHEAEVFIESMSFWNYGKELSEFQK